MTQTVRAATQEDVAALTALELAFPEEDRFSRRTWQRLLRGNSAILVSAGAAGLAGALVLLSSAGGGFGLARWVNALFRRTYLWWIGQRLKLQIPGLARWWEWREEDQLLIGLDDGEAETLISATLALGADGPLPAIDLRADA